MMKSVTLLLVLLFLSPFLIKSQEKTDIGAIAGSSYYLGDYNPSTQFKMLQPAFGLIYRRNLNRLYSLRFAVTTGKVKGSHNQADFFLPNLPANPSFSQRFYLAEGNVEIGFIPFGTKYEDIHKFTPYVILGAGATYVSNAIAFQIPMGIGIKYTPYNRWTIGAEWKLHKTFTDNIDGYITPSDNNRFTIHNYDWFGIAGFFVTFRLVKKGAICPAYK
jgi:hypothetical protein